METIRIAATALNTHKLRSFLTLLGVIIGVMTVVSVVSIIAGLNNYITEKVFQLNPDVYVVTQFGIITSREQFLEAIKRKKLDWSDYQAIIRRCDRCAMVGASESMRAQTKRGAKKLGGVRIQGGTANMAEINNLDLEAGRFYTGTEDDHSTLVAVIGSDVRDELFGKIDPIGRTIWIANQPVRVIGLLREQGAVLGENQDNQLWMPLSTWRKRFGARRSIDLFIKSTGGIGGMQASMDEVRNIIRSRRRTAFRGEDPFGMVSAEALQTLWKNISASAVALMTIISGISLVVGGIVIMNIMLVSVVERTREIGVRRALGATKRNIQMQFLTEAILLSLGGGAAGVILGYIISKAIATFSPMPTLVRPSLVISGLMIAVVTGIVAGWIPARRAAGLPPIDSLRYE
ncbi:MAG: ABC transporter permease [Thermoanaerobaculia bacterium]|nr:ABC transporter permease [Thermoanaerobaculia bacterium]